MRLVQFLSDGQRAVGRVMDDGSSVQAVAGAASIREMAIEAHRNDVTLTELVEDRIQSAEIDYDRLIGDKLVLSPLDHPDPAHCHVTGTGLTHLGSAKARNSMHADASNAPVTDSMRLFQWGLDGGKPAGDEISVQPEWFYKGTGDCAAAPEHAIESPGFARDGGEEAELVGLYVVAEDGSVLRVGFAIGNEFSDHVMERQNYLYLAHSKLRPCSFGPELLVGDLPSDIRGQVRIIRDNAEIWSEPFKTGEANMSYTIGNLEHHHFKYTAFRRAGDVHCHFFGTATLSFSAGITTQAGDLFEISSAVFGRPLRNALSTLTEDGRVAPVAMR